MHIFAIQNGCQDPKQHHSVITIVTTYWQCQGAHGAFYGFFIRTYCTIYRITWHSSNVFSDIACVGSSDLSTHSLSHSRNQIALSTPFKTCLQVSMQQTANQSICCYPFTKRLSRQVGFASSERRSFCKKRREGFLLHAHCRYLFFLNKHCLSKRF